MIEEIVANALHHNYERCRRTKIYERFKRFAYQDFNNTYFKYFLTFNDKLAQIFKFNKSTLISSILVLLTRPLDNHIATRFS